MIPSFARPRPSLIVLACLLSALSPSRAASLVVNTTLLQRSGDAVLVTWSDVQPSPSDNITVTANNLTILQVSATACPSWQQGLGSLAVRLVDIYAPLTITYTTPLGMLAASPPITFSDPNQPLFPRLSLLGDPANTLVLTWTAAQFTSNERVLLRPAGCTTCNFTTFSLLPDGKGAVTYSVKDMCGGVAKTTGWFEPGWQLSAALPGLDPSSDYDYLFGTPDSMSQVMRLSTPPAAASAASKVTVYLFGDMGVAAAPPNGFPASLSTVQSIRDAAANATDGEYSMVMHIGDVSYAMGYQFYWPLFLDQIQPLASRSLYQLSIGTHSLPQLPHAPSCPPPTNPPPPPSCRRQP